MVQTGEQLISTDSERALLIYMIGVILLVSALIIIFFVVFQKRKNKILIDKMKEKQRFEEVLLESQIEIQEQTLKNVGQELHDNVGQLLSYASMQLNLIASTSTDGLKTKIEDAKKVIGESIDEVRAMSKSLNQDVIANFGLISSVNHEIERLNKLQTIQASLSLLSDKLVFNSRQDELILFRIIQEFISNTLKYSNATNLDIRMEPYSDNILITLPDNGDGFDADDIKAGSGLINMKSRANLIKTDIEYTTIPGDGVRLRLFYPTTLEKPSKPDRQ
ncbi:MAG: histidine kinase [Bacteroidia bacterium]|nr:histidine kinase [Bacteroidia bacterium]